MTIKVRAAEPGDAVAIKAIYEQPHAYAGTLQLPYPSEVMWQQRYASQSSEFYSLVAEIDGRLVGQLGLMTQARPRRKHVADFGMGVCASALRKGVGTALLEAALDMCDNWLNIHRVELEVYTDNQAAITLYKKCGFEIEGEHPDDAFRDGRYVSVYSMGRIRPNR
ncbi:GNAT family N-acetyltransferase [Paraferrimonas sedimenticola]|uniref:Acetyltransferase n=1 Tax=Paraferrimonas sedimenticola TaxID=375674 RepID=A0AA37VWN0_9GAMM|nr:GNAT family N-acetyltransferase [Paraferrimonas sedimenticola]GLP96431.1 acetyltransferase [Paraferrimonas sedimenticola]